MNNLGKTRTMKKKNIILGAFLLFFTGLFFFSCKDKGTNPLPIEDTSFRFKVIVKDSAGIPVNGLRVSAWNILSLEGNLHKTSTQKLSKISATTFSSALQFEVPIAAQITFSVFNLRDQEIATLVNGQRNSGRYSVIWKTPLATFPATPSGVYKCKLVAIKTSSDSVLFQDSIYTVLHQPDPETTVLGWTSQSGIFETTDALLFPKVLDPPLFVHTDPTGPDSLGTFYYTDSVAIVLTDTVTRTQHRFNAAIGKQVNTYNLTWNPTASPTPFIERSSIILHKAMDVHPIAIPTSWKLYQNYPNPFN